MTVLPSTLRPFPALSSLADSELAAMSKVLVETSFRSGSQICREGDAGDGCYFLVAGRVEVTKQLQDSRRVFLAHLGEGAIFGQGALVPGQSRSADVRAVGNVRVLTLRPMEHQWALGQGAAWAVLVQRLVCVNVIRQLRSALARLGDLAGAEHPELFTGTLSPSGGEIGGGSGRAEASPVLEDEPSESHPIPPLPAPHLTSHDATTTGRLLTLLAETEASLANDGVDLDQVQFVVDEDAHRRATTSRSQKG